MVFVSSYPPQDQGSTTRLPTTYHYLSTTMTPLPPLMPSQCQVSRPVSPATLLTPQFTSWRREKHQEKTPYLLTQRDGLLATTKHTGRFQTFHLLTKRDGLLATFLPVQFNSCLGEMDYEPQTAIQGVEWSAFHILSYKSRNKVLEPFQLYKWEGLVCLLAPHSGIGQLHSTMYMPIQGLSLYSQ